MARKSRRKRTRRRRRKRGGYEQKHGVFTNKRVKEDGTIEKAAIKRWAECYNQWDPKTRRDGDLCCPKDKSGKVNVMDGAFESGCFQCQKAAMFGDMDIDVDCNHKKQNTAVYMEVKHGFPNVKGWEKMYKQSGKPGGRRKKSRRKRRKSRRKRKRKRRSRRR